MADHEPIRFFTRARHIPTLFGKLPGSRWSLPGGPYTLTQALVAVAPLATVYLTRHHWSQHANAISLGVLAGALGIGLALAVGRLPLGGRNPVSILTGFYLVWTAPRLGMQAGKEIRITRPVRVRGRQPGLRYDHVTTALPVDPGSAPEKAPASKQPIVPAEPMAPVPANTDSDRQRLSDVQRLLAATAKKG